MNKNKQFQTTSRKRLSELVLGFGLAALILGTNLPAHAAGDPKAGKAVAAVCLACHGQNGMSTNPVWPNLAGQKEAYLVKQLRAFRTGERNDPVMAPQAKSLTDADIDNISAYFSSFIVTVTEP